MCCQGRPARSYGLAVAQLAGVPNDVISRAREHLSRLEATALPHDTVVASPKKSNSKSNAPHQSDMFASLPIRCWMNWQNLTWTT